MTRNHCIVDARDQVVRCEACGEEIPIPLGSIKWVAAVCKAFEEAHQFEGHKPGRTFFSTPTPKKGPTS